MNVKDPTISVGFFGLAFLLLSIHLIFSASFLYSYFQIGLALLFVLGGIIILISLTTKKYPNQRDHKFTDEFQLLKEDLYFFLIEIAKVASIYTITFSYPLISFFLFLCLDCLDGMLLSHTKRALPLRHRIDKLTDLLCQLPMYYLSTLLWPELLPIFTFFLIITIIKTAVFLRSGNRNVLIIFPGFFLILYFTVLIIFKFFESYAWLFTDLYAVTVITFFVIIITVLYEAIYNGALSRLRYNVEVRVNERD